jgi:Zn-dependent protease
MRKYYGMKIPTGISPNDQTTVIGKIFDTPIVVEGYTWLPTTQLLLWFILYRVEKHNHPQRRWDQHIGKSAISTLIILGSEWCHNLAHATAAHMIGKPMDALRILWGLPRIFYANVNDENVTPRQHIIRALGGPVFNAMITAISLCLKRFIPQNSTLSDAVDITLKTNAFLSTNSLLPIPYLDGGPLLKWSLVERGNTIHEADDMVKRVNLITGAGLGFASGIALKKRRRFIGVILGVLALTSWAIGFGRLKEQ